MCSSSSSELGSAQLGSVLLRCRHTEAERQTGGPVCSPLATGRIFPAGLLLQTGVQAAATTRSCSAATVPGVGGGAGEVGGVGLPESTGGQARVDGLTLPATAQQRGDSGFTFSLSSAAQTPDQRGAEEFPQKTLHHSLTKITIFESRRTR